MLDCISFSVRGNSYYPLQIGIFELLPWYIVKDLLNMDQHCTILPALHVFQVILPLRH